MPNSTSSRKTDNWTKFGVVQLYGTYYLGKMFALVAGPLVALLLFHRTLINSLYRALTRKHPLSFVCWMLVVSIMYGIFGVAYGVLSGYDLITALQILVFNFCPLYLFLGIWAGARRPQFLQHFIKFSLWYNTIFTFAYFLVLRNMMRDDDAIGHPGSNLMIFLAPFCYEYSLSVYWLPVLVGTFDLIAAQIRADWAGLGIAVIIWGIAAKKIKQVFSVAGVVLGLLIVGFIFDVRVPGFSDRGGEISARDTVGRALSSFDPDLAREYNSTAGVYAGTVQWREKWWSEIRDTVSQSPTTMVFGMGYGYPIGDLVSYLKGLDIRTPHSILYFTLCYSGFIGVVIFFALQIGILSLHWQTFKATGQIYGFVTHIALLTSAFFGNLFEAPQAAIPLYLILGMAIGPLFAKQFGEKEAAEPGKVIILPPATQMGRRMRMRGYSPVLDPAAND